MALVGFGAIRSGAGAEVKRLIERFQIPLLTTLDGKGIVSEGHPLCGRASSATAATPAPGRRSCEADVVLCIGNSLNQHATFNYREDLFEGKTLIHINISEDEIDKAYKADHALVSDARPAVAALVDALEPKVGEVAAADVDGQDYEARHIIHLTDSIHPGELAQSIGRMLPPRAILLADAGAHLAGSATTSSWRRARTSARPARSGRWPGTSTAPSA